MQCTEQHVHVHVCCIDPIYLDFKIYFLEKAYTNMYILFSK